METFQKFSFYWCKVNILTFDSHLHSSFGDGDGLLLHGLMDGHLVSGFHLIKLINTANTLRITVYFYIWQMLFY